jgi:membrane peptidoglycan carboxypeptidase
VARPPGRRGVSRDYPDDARTRDTADHSGGQRGSAQRGSAQRGSAQRGSAQRGATRTAPPRPGAPLPAHGRTGPGRPGGRPPGAPKRFIDYPRGGRRAFTRWIPSWRLVGTLTLLGATLGVLAFFVAYATTPIPDGKQSATFQTSTVYFRNGAVLGRFAQENRTLVSITDVPDSLRYAVLAAEDRSFETNPGVSITGTVRALVNNVRGGSLQGGSTITQQYVKNYYLNSDRTVQRKARETLIALKVGRTQTKDQILEGYLNTIYFGRNANGVQAAAKAYFGKTLDPAVVAKDPSKGLTASESAFLAGIINGPELYDPADGAESTQRATRRWQFVVDGMVAQGWLTADEAASMRFPKVVKFVSQNTPKGYRGYLLQMVRKEAATHGISAGELDTAGYDIYTTFDPKLMDAAQQAITDKLPDSKKWPKGTRVAMATIDVPTGEIRSIYGGADYLERQQNGATQDIMQAGSTFKPFALLAALQGKRSTRAGECRPTITDGAVSLDSRFDGSSPKKFDDYEKQVRNFGNSQYGMIDLRKATASSVNTVYVALNEQIGPQQTRNAAICAGLPTSTNGLQANLANVLGTASPHPIDMAFAYSTIANNGKRTTLHAIKSIQVHQTKKKVYQATVATKQVFDPQVTANAIEAMQQVVRRGSGTYAQRLDRPVAGKTGTSSSNQSAWFVGFTPQLATSVAMYRMNDDGTPADLKGFGQFDEITGGSFPVRVWTDFMSQALDGAEVKDFPEAQDIGETVNPAPRVTRTPTTGSTTQTPTASPTGSPTASSTDSPTPSPTDPPSGTDTPTGTETTTKRGRPRPTVTLPASP